MGYWEEFASGDSLTAIAIKMGVAILLSGLVGIEREIKGRAAGLRTHVLVCLGSTMTMMVGDSIAQVHALSGSPVWLDSGRIAAGIITGIGFLGAGTVMTVGGTQRGLTTAATIWFVAALGIAVGVGHYAIATASTLAAMFVIVCLKPLETILPFADQCVLTLQLKQGHGTAEDVERVISARGFKVKSARTRLLADSERVEVVFEISGGAAPKKTELMRVLQEHFPDSHSISCTF